MIKLVLFISLISLCSNEPCGFSEKEFNSLLKILLSKKIIEKSDKELNIQLNNKLLFLMPDHVVLEMDTINLFENKVGIPTINILNIKKNDDKSLIIVFFINKLSRRYRGNINFKCHDNKLVFDEIIFHSEID